MFDLVRDVVGFLSLLAFVGALAVWSVALTGAL
jgi:hypothetical protein